LRYIRSVRRALDRGLWVLAWALALSMLAEAVHDVSLAWDVWFYHLPFAARIAGIVPPEQFAYDAINQSRFDGFPLLAEALQGVLWRVTGRAECANLVAFAAVPLFAWFVKKRLDVPMHLTVIGLLAVPLVQMHATSCYVDLPGNAAAGALVLLAMQLWADERPASIGKSVALACLLGGIAANTKALLHPVVLVALVAIAVRLVRLQERRLVVLMGLALPVVFATPLKNLFLHHNPYYPVAFQVFGHTLPGPDEPYSSSPVWLEHAPRFVRFVCSVLEVGVHAAPNSRRWTVDQWTPPDASGYRMGGFFGVYMAVLLAHLAWRAVRGWKDRTVRAAVLGFVALTAIVALLPQSHELRYYMGWAMVLVAVNLWLARRAEAQVFAGLACAVALGMVLFITHGEYAYPSGESFKQLVHASVDEGALNKVHDGDRICVRRAPWTFLYASRFHAPRSYAVKEADEVVDCEGSPLL
jgi:hypothetical protein